MGKVLDIDKLSAWIYANQRDEAIPPPVEPPPPPPPPPLDGPLGSVTNPYMLVGQIVSYSPLEGRVIYYSCDQSSLNGIQLILKTYNAPTEMAAIVQVTLDLSSGVFSEETLIRRGGGLIYRVCSPRVRYIFGIRSYGQWYQPWDVQIQMFR